MFCLFSLVNKVFRHHTLNLPHLIVITGYPAARRCHSCVQVKDGTEFLTRHNLDTLKCLFLLNISFALFLLPEVFICGGYNGELILSDLWKINLQTFQWTKLLATMPEPAYFHCAAVTPVSYLSFKHSTSNSGCRLLLCTSETDTIFLCWRAAAYLYCLY